MAMQWMQAALRTRALIPGVSAGLAGLLWMAGTVVAAERLTDRGTADEQAACTPDVFRLCSEYIPDETRIVACLTRAKRQLSPACRAVMAGEAPRTTRPRRASRPARTSRVRAPANPRMMRRADRAN